MERRHNIYSIPLAKVFDFYIEKEAVSTKKNIEIF